MSKRLNSKQRIRIIRLISGEKVIGGCDYSNVRALTPIPYKGEQGLFNVPDSVLEVVA